MIPKALAYSLRSSMTNKWLDHSPGRTACSWDARSCPPMGLAVAAMGHSAVLVDLDVAHGAELVRDFFPSAPALRGCIGLSAGVGQTLRSRSASRGPGAENEAGSQMAPKGPKKRIRDLIHQVDQAPDLLFLQSGWRDLNPRPLRPERSALPSCATPRSNELYFSGLIPVGEIRFLWSRGEGLTWSIPMAIRGSRQTAGARVSAVVTVGGGAPAVAGKARANER